MTQGYQSCACKGINVSTQWVTGINTSITIVVNIYFSVLGGLLVSTRTHIHTPPHTHTRLLIPLTHYSLKFVKWQSHTSGGKNTRQEAEKMWFWSRLSANWRVTMHTRLTTTLASMPQVQRERGGSADQHCHFQVPKQSFQAHDHRLSLSPRPGAPPGAGSSAGPMPLVGWETETALWVLRNAKCRGGRGLTKGRRHALGPRSKSLG